MKATHTAPEIQDTSVVWKAGEPKGTTNWETRLRRRNKGYPAVQCKVKASKHHFFVWSCLWFSVENGNLFFGPAFRGTSHLYLEDALCLLSTNNGMLLQHHREEPLGMMSLCKVRGKRKRGRERRFSPLFPLCKGEQNTYMSYHRSMYLKKWDESRRKQGINFPQIFRGTLFHRIPVKIVGSTHSVTCAWTFGACRYCCGRLDLSHFLDFYRSQQSRGMDPEGCLFS